MIGTYIRAMGADVLAKAPWRVGVVAFMAFPETLKGREVVGAAEALAADGSFDLVEFHVVDVETLRRVAKVLEEGGIELAAALQPAVLIEKCDVSSLEEGRRREAVDKLKQLIDVAHEAEVKKVALCTGPDPGPQRRAEALESLKRSLTELCDHAKSYAMTIYLENFDRDYDKRLLLGPTREAAEVVRELRREGADLWLLWDLSHAPLLHESPDVLRGVADVLGHVHVGCAERTKEGLKDYHPGFYSPGAVNGVEEVAHLLEVLADVGYSGALSFEVKPKPNETSWQVLHCSKGVLYSAFQKMLAKAISR